MKTEERKEVARALTGAFLMYSREISEDTLKLMLNALMDLEKSVILTALDEYIKNPKNNLPPTVGALRASTYVEIPKITDESIAIEAAGRIITAMAKYSQNSKLAREYIGELGWQAVQGFGGWVSLNDNKATTTLQAQLRDLCEAKLKLAKVGISDQPIGLPEPVRRNEIEYKKVLNLIETKKDTDYDVKPDPHSD